LKIERESRRLFARLWGILGLHFSQLLAKVAVDIAAAPDPHDKYQERSVLNLVDDPVIADTDSVKAKLAFQSFCSPRTRVIGQLVDRTRDALAVRLGDSRKRVRRRTFDLDSVGHLSPITS
jgi:hypothetical protein